MISLKTPQEIKIMKEGGKRLALVSQKILKEVCLGVQLNALNNLADELIKKQGGFPSFKMVKGYHWATCLSVNQGVVHGIPGSYRVKEGDLISLDIGIFFKGFHTDMANTIRVDSQNNVRSKDKFLEAGKKALCRAIAQAKPGNRVGHISAVIGQQIRAAGYSPIRALTGHGIGRELHEDPQIPCYLRKNLNKTELIKPGMTFAIEVIYAQGKPNLVLSSDGWTIKTADNSLAALFENTIAVTQNGPIVLTSTEN